MSGILKLSGIVWLLVARFHRIIARIPLAGLTLWTNMYRKRNKEITVIDFALTKRILLTVSIFTIAFVSRASESRGEEQYNEANSSRRANHGEVGDVRFPTDDKPGKTKQSLLSKLTNEYLSTEPDGQTKNSNKSKAFEERKNRSRNFQASVHDNGGLPFDRTVKITRRPKQYPIYKIRPSRDQTPRTASLAPTRPPGFSSRSPAGLIAGRKDSRSDFGRPATGRKVESELVALTMSSVLESSPGTQQLDRSEPRGPAVSGKQESVLKRTSIVKQPLATEDEQPRSRSSVAKREVVPMSKSVMSELPDPELIDDAEFTDMRKADSRHITAPRSVRLVSSNPVYVNFNDLKKRNTLDAGVGFKNQVSESSVRGASPVAESTNVQHRIGFGGVANDARLAEEDVDAIEYEEIGPHAPNSTTVAPLEEPAKPSDLWLNRYSKYNLSKIEQTERSNPASASIENKQGALPFVLTQPIRDLQPRQKAILVSFGDQDLPRDQPDSGKDPFAESEVFPDIGLQAADEDGDKGVAELEEEADNDDPELKVERQRSEYRELLRRPLSASPTQKALNYVDDLESPLPVSANQQAYLVGFSDYYNSPLENGFARSDRYGYPWQPKFVVWKSPDLCYQPLYYEEVNLERFGGRYPFFQPAISAAHFFSTTIQLPYLMGMDSPRECQFSAGYGRPGNSYCYQRKRFVWSLKAGSFQALLATAVVFALP